MERQAEDKQLVGKNNDYTRWIFLCKHFLGWGWRLRIFEGPTEMLECGALLLKTLGAAAAVFWVSANSKLRQQGWLCGRLSWLEDCRRTMRLVRRRVGIPWRRLEDGIWHHSFTKGLHVYITYIYIYIYIYTVYRRYMNKQFQTDSRSCSDNDENVLCAAYDFLANGQGLAGS